MSAVIRISGDEYTTNLVIPHIISVEEVEKTHTDLFEFKIMVVGTDDFYLFKFKNGETARVEQIQVLNAVSLYYKELLKT